MSRSALADRAIIGIRGPDAVAFLHGILTADVACLAPGSMCPAALLTPQGKILFDMIVDRRDDGFCLDIRADTADALAARLAFYRLRAKVEIAREPGLVVLWAETAGAGGLRLAEDPRLAALGYRAIAEGPADADASAEYHARRIAAGVAETGADFEPDSVFPHEANFDLLHGVAFDKGCFIGQEVVSRMHHRGTARKRFLPCTVEGAVPLRGTPVTAGGRTIGETGSGADGHVLALIRLDHLEEATASGTPVMAGDLRLHPYRPGWMEAAMTTRGRA